MNKHVEKIAAHPAAAVYRMMLDDELAELVASIGTNGLRDPITVGVIGAQRWIVDGRNRERACELAGVAPAYEEIEFADEEELRAFVGDRNERRNISKGQKAIAYAMLFPNAKNGGDRKSSASKSVLPGKTDPQGFSGALLSQARAIFAFAPELAEKVRDGFPLKEAFDMVDNARKMTEADGSLRDRLERLAPDLLTLVDEGKMKLREAIAALDQRLEEVVNLKKVATANFVRIIRGLDPRGGDPAVAEEVMFREVDAKFWPADGGSSYSRETIASCIDVLSAHLKRSFGK